MIQTASRPSKGRAAQQPGRRADGKDKCTLLLPSDLSIRLTVAAHLRGLDRSELATELLAEALKYVVISLRGQSPTSANPGVESTQANATAT
jgi:hypothetical protein